MTSDPSLQSTVALKLDLSSLESIVIVKPSSLGDIVHTLPLLSLLRQHAPQARIEWVVNSVWKPILEDHPLLDGLIEFPRQKFRGLGGLGAVVKWAREQRFSRPDLVLDVQGLFRSGLICWALNPRLSVGYSDARENANRFHHQQVNVDQKRSPHAVDRYLTFFQDLGLSLPDEVEFPLPEGTPFAGSPGLPEGDFVVLHPFSRGTGKSLTPIQVRDLVEKCAEIPMVIVGRGEEIDQPLAGNAVDLLNRTSLSELMWILRRAKFVVSVDSGPMHLASAVNPHLLSIHTWSDPQKVGPYRKEAWVWKSGEICQVRDYQEKEAEPEPTFPDSAIASVAAFLRQQVG